MIKASISELALQFAAQAKKDFPENPCYQLDETWPSLGILDRFTLWLRGRHNWRDADYALIHATACYIAAMAHDLWSAYEAEVLVDLRGSEVFIRAKGGPYIPGDEIVSIQIEKELVALLQHPQADFPVIGDFQRTIAFDYNRVSLFALGIFLGPSPFVDGPWNSNDLSYFKKPIATITGHLASQSADYYRQMFPEETIGAERELYLQGQLIYPATLQSEMYPVLDSALGVIRYFVANGLNNKQLAQLATNFCLIPDERISLTGLVLLCALGQEIPVAAVALSESLGMFMPLLRNSVLMAREELFPEHNPDWLTAVSFDKQAAALYKSELSLNFYPFLKLSTRFIKENFDNPNIREIIALLCFMQVKEAVEKIDKLVEEDPSFLELRLQRLWLESLRGNHKAMEKNLKALLSEPQADQLPGIYALWGQSCSLYGSLEEAPRRFRAAYNMVSSGHELFAELSLNYSMALMSEKRFDESLEVLNNCPDVGLTPMNYWTTKIALQRSLGKQVEAEASIAKLRSFAPYNRALMRELLFPHLSPDTINQPLS